MTLSFSPLYNQDVIWVSEYTDGTLLREWDDDGKEHKFSEIDKSKLKRFHLVSADFDYCFDCETGIFMIDGLQYVFPLAGLELNYAEGLIHFKEAFTEFVSAHSKSSEYDGFGILGYEFGWKVTKDNIKSQVIFLTHKKTFNIQVTFLDLEKTVSWEVKI